MSRLDGDARALHAVLGSNALNSAAIQEQLRRLQILGEREFSKMQLALLA